MKQPPSGWSPGVIYGAATYAAAEAGLSGKWFHFAVLGVVAIGVLAWTYTHHGVPSNTSGGAM